MATLFWTESSKYSRLIDLEKVLQLVDDYLRSHFIYFPEKIETLQTPVYMLNGLEINQYLVGDCDDVATLHAALLTCMAFEVQFIAIRSTHDDPNFDHVFIEANVHDEWIPFDVTVPRGTKLEYFARLAIKI